MLPESVWPRPATGSGPPGPPDAARPVPSRRAMADDDHAGDEDVTDALPDDLDASEYVGPYVFPNNNRRRVPGYLYLALGARVPGRRADRRAADGVLVNGGFCRRRDRCSLLIGAYHLVAGWNLDVDERDALVAATRAGRLPGRPRLGAAGLAGPAQPAHLAHPPVLGRGPARSSGPRAGRRRRRRDRRLLHRGQPRGLVRSLAAEIRCSGAMRSLRTAPARLHSVTFAFRPIPFAGHGCDVPSPIPTDRGAST